MRILVLNAGSSSIKFSLFDAHRNTNPHSALEGELSGIGQPTATLKIDGQSSPNRPAATPVEAVQAIFEAVTRPEAPPIDAVGYCVVHPGPKLQDHQRITPEVLADLEAAKAFAPLHDPEAVEVIRQGMARFPNIPHFACFDTVFHRTMPEEATTYPIPEDIRKQGVRRYGFHGLSCESILPQLPQPLPRRMIIAHLGSGCSVTALLDGRSIDTSMGLTPTGGVVMGTRPGDLDPGLVLYLLRQESSTDAVEATLNHHAGLVALSGQPNDMQAIRKANTPESLLALKIFTRSITKTIGAYTFLLGGLDALVFTGGIGEHDPATRAEVLAGLESFGIVLDSTLNLGQKGVSGQIQASKSTTAVFTLPAQEDLTIAGHVARMAQTP